MAIGVVGKKCGMTRQFTETGESIPVTVIVVEPNVIVQLKTKENDGYEAIQIATGKVSRSKFNKALKGHYAKASVAPAGGLWEFTVGDKPITDFSVGQTVSLDMFAEGDMVDVTSVSRGKGFAGTVKRHNFRTQDATHGNSLSHRAPGSIGQRQTPGRVMKNKKMSGQMGNKQVTVQNQPIVSIDKERNLILVRGVVPGAPGASVIIRLAVKSKKRRAA